MKQYLRILLLTLLVFFIPQQCWATALANSKIQYVGSVEYTAITAWQAGTITAAGALTRPTGPSLGNERIFAAIVAGTTSAVSQPAWPTTKGGEVGDNGITWEEVTGQPCVNGDTTNSPVWGATLTTVQGQIIYDSNTTSCQIVSSNGGTTNGSAPSFSGTAGVTTTDNTVTWTSLGAASNFGAFKAPHERIANADAATWQTVVPAKIFIASDHAESQASALTLTGGQGVAANPNQYLSVVKTTAPPTSVTAGAAVTTTGASALQVQGFGYYYGVTWNAGTGSTSANLIWGNGTTALYCDTCTFNIVTTAIGSRFVFGNTSGNSASSVFIQNSTLTFASTSQQITVGSGKEIWIGGSMAATGSIPTTLAGASGAGLESLIIRDTDISKITGSIYNAGTLGGVGTIFLENDKLGSGVTPVAGAFTDGGQLFKMHNSDSGSKNYRFYEQNYLGTLQQETTTVDNTNPSSDGTTTISLNLTTSANTSFGQPYFSEYFPVRIWENTTGSTITPQIQIAGANTLTNADIWPECEFLSTSGFPLGVVVSGRASDPLVATSNWATSSDSWGGSPAHKQIMSVTSASIQLKGLVNCRIGMAKASTTEYINLNITNIGITSGRQYLNLNNGYIDEGSKGGGSIGYAY